MWYFLNSVFSSDLIHLNEIRVSGDVSTKIYVIKWKSSEFECHLLKQMYCCVWNRCWYRLLVCKFRLEVRRIPGTSLQMTQGGIVILDVFDTNNTGRGWFNTTLLQSFPVQALKKVMGPYQCFIPIASTSTCWISSHKSWSKWSNLSLYIFSFENH